MTSVYNDERFSDVTRLAGNSWAYHGKHYNGGGTSWNVQDRRTVSAWVKTGGDGAFLIVVMNTSDQLRGLWYRFNSPPQGYTMAEPYQYIDNRALFGTHLAQDGKWRRLERDVVADFQAAYPSETFREIAGLTLTSYTATPVEIQNVRLGNSMTVEHNTLGGGVIGHILRNRRIDTQTYAATDKWFHYDQVGSVIRETGQTGSTLAVHHPDSYGNRMSSWETGLWGTSWAARAGWGHNTKELMADTGLVYMYQRWYNPETGTFLSKAPYPPMMEHAYGFANQDPMTRIDPEGTWDYIWPWSKICCSGASGLVDYAEAKAAQYGKKDKYKHCLIACVITRCTGGVPGPALIAQIIWEIRSRFGGSFVDAVWDTAAAAYGTLASPLVPCDEYCKIMP